MSIMLKATDKHLQTCGVQLTQHLTDAQRPQNHPIATPGPNRRQSPGKIPQKLHPKRNPLQNKRPIRDISEQGA